NARFCASAENGIKKNTETSKKYFFIQYSPMRRFGVLSWSAIAPSRSSFGSSVDVVIVLLGSICRHLVQVFFGNVFQELLNHLPNWSVRTLSLQKVGLTHRDGRVSRFSSILFRTHLLPVPSTYDTSGHDVT